MKHPSRILEGSSAEINVDYRCVAQEVSEGNNITDRVTNHSCGTLAKTLLAFCPYSKTLPEAKWKHLNSFYWQRRFQNSLMLTLLHSYY